MPDRSDQYDQLPDPTDGFSFLSPADAEALDALIDTGFEPTRADGGTRVRAQQLLGLLGGLDLPAPGGAPLLDAASSQDRRDARLLVDVTMARVMRADREGVAARVSDADPTDETLNTDDSRRVDQLVGGRFRVSADADPGAAKLSSLLGLLDRATVPSDAELNERRASLIDATLANVQRSIDKERSRFMLPVDALQPARRGLRLADLGAVAVAAVVGFAVLGPVVIGARESTRTQLCAQNLSTAGFGVNLFAGNHDGRIPNLRDMPAAASTSTSNDPAQTQWWNVGQAPSHSANLYVLIRGGYVTPADLACPGNAEAPIRIADSSAVDWQSPAEVSYSYQLFGDKVPRLSNGTRMVILTDKSPAVDRARRGETIDPTAPSRNHGPRGQMVLFSDGSVVLLASPVLESGDNIWLPRSVEQGSARTLTGRETPAGTNDAFVGP